MNLWTLEVGRSEFLQALRLTVAKTTKAASDSLVLLTFSDGHLTFEVVGGKVQMPAHGTWPGVAALGAHLLKRLRLALPKDDPLKIQTDGNELRIARLSLPCECREMPERAPELHPDSLPPNLSLRETLKLGSQHSPGSIEAAGLAPTIAAAQKTVDDILKRAATLLQPYGVAERDLRVLLQEHVADTDCAFQETDKAVIKRIAEAWKLLAPFGIEAGEIKALVDNSIRNAWKR